ncbi:MAG: beta strand repeat-containing protein [Planctomycetota bacterium]|jgi:hypothetical protein
MKQYRTPSLPARTVRALLFATLLLPVLCGTAVAQGVTIDENWTLTVNGQTVTPNPDGTFSITNIAAPDLFGPGGPGTAPDFLSDDFQRLTGIGVVDGTTYYCFSEPFQIENNVTFEVGEITITTTPPPLPEYMRIFADQSAIEITDTLQLQVIGYMGTGTQDDLTDRDTWTVYRTSNTDIAEVDEDGLITGNAEGVAFITAINNGATAVIRIDVVQSTVDTTVEGFVQLEDGSPLDGANVSTSFGGNVLTDSTGFFSLDVTLPTGATVSILANGDDSGTDVTGGVSDLPVVPDGITDAGIIVAAAAVVWIAPSSGDWDDPGNWSTGLLPAPGENVVIDVTGNIVEIDIPSGTSIDISSLTCNENLTLRTGATLSVDGIVQVSAQFDINGGTLQNATILPGANGEGMEISNHCTLDDVTLECDVDMTATGRTVTVVNGMTINGLFSTTSSSSVTASGGQTFDGSGELFFEQFGYLRRSTGGTLTIGSDLLVRGYGYFDAPMINNGTIRCDQNGRGIWFFNTSLGGTLINNGLIEGTNGGDIDIRCSPFTNNGTLLGDGTNTIITVQSATWTNNGTVATTAAAVLTLKGDWDDFGSISVTDGTLNFGRTNFDTDDLAGVSTTNSAFNLTSGTFDNADNIFAPGSAYNIGNITIVGGILQAPPGGEIVISGNPVFDDLEIDGDISASSRTIYIQNGFTLNGTFSLTYSRIYWRGTQTCDGAGEFLLAGGWNYWNRQNGGTTTYGSDIVVRHTSTNGEAYIYGPLVNNGEFRTEGGRTMYLWGTDWENSGDVIGDASHVRIDSSGFLNNASGNVDVTDGTLFLLNTWTDNGSISVTDGILNLGGNIGPSDLSAVSRTNSQLNLFAATFNNVGNNLALTENMDLLGGTTINGGDITVPPTETLRVTGTTTLDDVNLNGILSVVGSAQLFLKTAFTLNGMVDINQGYVYTTGTMTVDGTGEFLLGSTAWGYMYRSGGGIATFETDITIRTGAGTSNKIFNGPFVMKGTLLNEVSGRTLFLQGTNGTNEGLMRCADGGIIQVTTNSFTNNGTMECDNGATLRLQSATWTNTADIDATGGSTLLAAGSWTDTGSMDVTDSMLDMGGNFTVAHLGAFNRTNSDLIVSGTFDLEAGTFTLGEDLDLQGTIKNGTFTVPVAQTMQIISTSTLDGITLNGDIDVLNGRLLYLQNGLTLNGTMTLMSTGSWTYIRFRSTMTIDGTGDIVFGGTAQYNRLDVQSSAYTYTIGSDITIREGRGYLYNDFVVNGTIRSDGASQWKRIGDAGGSYSWTNNGAVEVLNGAQTWLGQTWTNTGDIDVTNGSTLNTTGAWTDTGNIVVTDSTLNIAGAYTSDQIAGFSLTNSTLSLAGSMDNTGLTYTATQTVNLAGVTVTGGNLDTSGIGLFDLTSHSTFDGVTLDGDIDVPNGRILYLTNGLTLNGTITLKSAGSWTYLRFRSTMTIDGTGDIIFGGTAQYNRLDVQSTAYTYTIGSDITIREGRGYFYYNFVLNGTVRSDGAGQWKRIGDAGTAYSWTNNGAIEVLNGAETWLGENWTNTGDIDVTNGSTLNTTGSWSDTGTIDVTDSTLNLDGAYTSSQIAGFSLTNSTLSLDGAMNNTATTYTATQAVQLNGVTITGGTVDTSGAGVFNLTAHSTLSGVTLEGNIDVPNGRILYLNNGLTLNGSITLASNGSWTYLRFLSTMTIDGTGDIIFGGTAQYNRLDVQSTAYTYTIGSDITIREGQGYLYYNFVLNGTIRSDGASQWKRIGIASTAYSWTHSGTVEVLNGAQTWFEQNWSGTGTTTVDGTSTLNTNGAYSSTDVEAMDIDGTLNLGGTMNNAGQTFLPDPTWGAVNLGGVRVNGGTIDTTGFGSLGMTANSTLDNVTLDGDQVVPNSRILYLNNGLTLNGSITLASTGSWTYLRFQSTMTIDGTGDIIFGGTAQYNRLDVQSTAYTYTIGSDITIREGRGYLYYNFVLNGTIRSDGASQWKQLGVASTAYTWTHSGTVEVLNGAQTWFEETWSSTGTTTVDGTSTLHTNGAYSSTDIEGMDIDGTLNLGGTMDNTSATFSPASTWGTLNFAGVTVDGGTVDIPTGLDANSTSSSTRFDGVTLEGDLNVSNGAYLRVVNGFINNGKVTLSSAGSWTYIYFEGTQTMGGTGEVEFAGTANTNRLDGTGGTVYTIGAGITVGGANGSGHLYRGWINNGTVTCDGTGHFISLNGSTGTNNGTIGCTGDAGITLNFAFTNDGVFEIGSDCVFTCNDTLTLSSTSTVSIGIDGTGAGNFGVLDVNATCALDGTLELVFDSGGTFVATDSFDCIEYSSASNDFSAVTEQNLPGGLTISTTVGATIFTVTLN